MAIYNVDSINEQELASNDILDNMLEACDQMLSSLDESTAAQRHYGVTSKELGKQIDGSGVKFKNNPLTRSIVKKTAKTIADLRSDDAKQAGQSVYDNQDRETKEYMVKGKAMMNAHTGANLARYARTGMDVKGMVDKETKKRAIKETCLTILSVLDEI